MTKNHAPKTTRPWLIAASGAFGFITLLLLLGAALLIWLPSNAVLAERAAKELGAALGAPTRIGSLQWQLLPQPTVVLQDISVGSVRSLRIQQLSLYPALGAALRGQLQLDRVQVAGATLPQKTLRRLVALNQATQASGLAANWLGTETPLMRLDLSDLTWIASGGNKVRYAGQIDFDPHWRPRQATIDWPDSTANGEILQLKLSRQAQQDHWRVLLSLGNGSTEGEVGLQQRSTTGVLAKQPLQLQLQGSLESRDMDVAGLLKAFNLPPLLTGKAAGPTRLSANGADFASLAQSLQSSTEFDIGKSALQRFNLRQAVQTGGLDYAGKTELEHLSGRLNTQNTATGIVLDFSQVKARSSGLSATGYARLENQQIAGEFSIDLVDGLIGVPLKISGSSQQIVVSLPKGAVAGAALGSALLPGVGTALGARLGATLGQVLTPPVKP